MNAKPMPPLSKISTAIQHVLDAGARRERTPLHAGRRHSVAAAMLSACSLAAATAYADDGPGVEGNAPANADETEVVIVEGEREGGYRVDRSASSKFTDPLLDTPRTINAISKEAIEDSGSTTIKDVFRLQPGITIGTGEGGNAFGDRIFIRGYDARNDIYVDGLRDPGVVSRETFAVEQIEVLRGPGSTIGGRGTTGGAVRIVTKTPVQENFFEPQLTLGAGESKRLALDANRTIDDRVAVRFNLLAHDTAEVAGRDSVHDRRLGGAVAASIRPTDNLTVTFDYYRLATDGVPDWGHPYDAAGNRPYEVDRDNFYGLVERDYHDTSADIRTGRILYTFSDSLRVEAQARHGVTTNAYVVSAPGFSTRSCPGLDPASQVCTSAKTRDQQNGFTGGQVNVITDLEAGPFDVTLVGGFERSREEIENLRPSVSPRSVVRSLHAPDPYTSWNGTIAPATRLNRTEVDTGAAYLLGAFRLDERWRLSAGLRRDMFDIAAATGPSDYSSEPATTRHGSDFTNWNLGVVFKPAPDGSLYASVSTSSNPPGEQVDGGTSASYGGLAAGFQNFAPERNANYEAGVKWNLFDQRLNVAGAVFQTAKEDQLSAAGRGSSARYANDGASRARGFSLSIAGSVSEWLDLFGGFARLDTEVTAHSLNPDAVGKSLANVPEFSASLQSRYQVTPALAVGGTLYYQSELYGGTLEAWDTRIPGYLRVDFMGEYRWSERMDLRLNVVNAADKTYYDTLYRSSVPFVYVAPGRLAQLTLSLKI